MSTPDPEVPSAEEGAPRWLPIEFEEESPQSIEREKRQDRLLLKITAWLGGIVGAWLVIIWLTTLTSWKIGFVPRAIMAGTTIVAVTLIVVAIRRHVTYRRRWTSKQLPPPIVPSRFAVRHALEPEEVDQVLYDHCRRGSWAFVALLNPIAIKPMGDLRRLKLMATGSLIHLLIVGGAVSLYVASTTTTPWIAITIAALYCLYVAAVAWYWRRRHFVITLNGVTECTQYGPFGTNSKKPRSATTYTNVDYIQSPLDVLLGCATLILQTSGQDEPVATYRWVALPREAEAILNGISKRAHGQKTPSPEMGG